MINREDAVMMFSGSLVRYQSSLVYVMDILPNGIMGFSLERQRVENTELNYEDLKPISSRLGYLDLGSICVFVCRSPVRKYKVGISKQNIKICWGDFAYSPIEQKFILNAVESLSGQCFVNTFYNLYPSLREALKRINAGAKIVPFERQFAIDVDKQIYYKGSVVGTYQSATEDIQMHKGKEHLLSIMTNRG